MIEQKNDRTITTLIEEDAWKILFTSDDFDEDVNKVMVEYEHKIPKEHAIRITAIHWYSFGIEDFYGFDRNEDGKVITDLFE